MRELIVRPYHPRTATQCARSRTDRLYGRAGGLVLARLPELRRHLDRLLHRPRARVGLRRGTRRPGGRIPARLRAIRAAASPAAALARHAVRRLLFFRPGTAGFLWRSLWDTARARALPTGELLDPRWPSHLHTNLLPRGARMRCRHAADAGVARAAARRRVAGLPPGDPGGERAGDRLFTRMGFDRFGPPLLRPGMRLRSGGRMHLQLMTQTLSSQRPDGGGPPAD